jgi:N-acetylneuraminate lyase
MTAEGKPALGALEKLTDLFARQGLGGLYIGGSTGQWITLTVEERMALAECVVKTAAGRIPVMVHVGAATTADAVMLARHAERVGADAVSSVAPIYYSHGADAIFQHYHHIGAATGLPLYVYHLSIVNQTALSPKDYTRRLLELPNIAGMKLTDRDMYMLGLIEAYGGKRLRIFSGADEILLSSVLFGAIGAIGTFYNLFGPTCARAWSAFSAGNLAAGQTFMRRFQTAIDEVLASGSVWSFLRAGMMQKYGIDIGMPRPPSGSADKPWDDADVERVIQKVDTALDQI